MIHLYEVSELPEDLHKISTNNYPAFMLGGSIDKGSYCDQCMMMVTDARDAYLVFAEDYNTVAILDMCGNWRKEIFELIHILDSIIGDRAVICNCRESTSYPIVKLLERRGTIKIVSDDSVAWETEVMHNMTIKINRGG